MANNFECENCGAVHHGEQIEMWGRTKESDGMGPVPICTDLVPAHGAPPAKDSLGRVREDDIPMQVCRGSLRRAPEEMKPDKGRARPSLIIEGKRT
jgi:hypothetical protein